MAGPSFQFLAGAGSGFAGGMLSGMFGVGGAIVQVPLLALALHLDQHQAQGATLAAMLLPNGLPAVQEHGGSPPASPARPCAWASRPSCCCSACAPCG